MTRSIVPVTASLCVLALSLCIGCADSTTEPAASTPNSKFKPAEQSTLEECSPQLTETEQEATSAQPRGQVNNLINDPSLEDASLGRLPRGWSTYLKDGPNFRCQVVNDGHTGKQCLQIQGEGTRAVVFTNGVTLDRTKRYALKGWAKFEGDGNAKAIIKFNYFHNGKWLGVNDLIGVSSNQEGWQLLEKTDAADDFPEASQVWVSCKIEGSGKAWFDDLELVVYDRSDLPADFDSRHGNDNLSSRLLVLDRWLGQWESTRSHKPTDASAEAAERIGISNAAKTLDDHILQSYWISDDGDEETLSLLAYDENSGEYRLWTFSSSGAALEFAGQWNDATNTMTLQLVPPAPGVSGTNTTRFVDADTIETSLIVRSKDGVVTRDIQEALTRKSEKAAEDVPPANDNLALSPQLKTLQRFIGSWEQQVVSKPAEWTPEKTVMPLSTKCEWILGGRMVQGKAEWPTNGIEGLVLMTYDVENKEYRQWIFDSTGAIPREKESGKWEEATKTFTWTGRLANGTTSTGVQRFIDKDTHEWTLDFKDRAGKIYLDMEGTAKRK